MTPEAILDSLTFAKDEEPPKPAAKVQRCPVCRSVHPSDVACKPGELRDNGPTVTHISRLPT